MSLSVQNLSKQSALASAMSHIPLTKTSKGKVWQDSEKNSLLSSIFMYSESIENNPCKMFQKY